ncbi:hypothetical protein BN1708_012403 [Verticillium longisporum]|uniref:Uncharacterized protein n=1 Tax=Verticillium longisporum TaxID=100787 RepID=A0A0G4LA43_VERLO|nr:hypothetical protein BN1708_012403 [Verticillium longisporum]
MPNLVLGPTSCRAASMLASKMPTTGLLPTNPSKSSAMARSRGMQCDALSYMSACVLMSDGPVGHVQYVSVVSGKLRLARTGSKLLFARGSGPVSPLLKPVSDPQTPAGVPARAAQSGSPRVDTRAASL